LAVLTLIHLITILFRRE